MCDKEYHHGQKIPILNERHPMSQAEVKNRELLETVLPNLRDLSVSGGIQSKMKPGVLYRSARTFAESTQLVQLVFCDMLNIKTVIDLRSENLSMSPSENISRILVAKVYSTDQSISSVIDSQNVKQNVYRHSKRNSPQTAQHLSFPNQAPLTEKIFPFDSSNTKSQDTDGSKDKSIKTHRSGLSTNASQDTSLQEKRNSLVSQSSSRYLFIVDILNSPKVRFRIIATMLQSFTLPLFLAYKLTDKMVGSSLAPYYFCKYFISQHDILDSYIEILNCCGRNLCEVLKLITVSEIPILFHCSIGKDRTGILSIFLLSILRASDENIVNDYVLTECTSDAFMAYRYNYIVNLSGLDEKFIYANPNTCRGLLKFLREQWGSVDGYLDTIGFDDHWRSMLRSRFLISS